MANWHLRALTFSGYFNNLKSKGEGMAIRVKDLEHIVGKINNITGSPVETWATNHEGKAYSCVGNYHLDGAYGGWALHRVQNTAGGIEDVLSLGHVPKPALYYAMRSYLLGLEGPR